MASLASHLWWPLRAVDRGIDAVGGRPLRCIWAVARQTFAEAIRMKIAVFFFILMALGFWGATQTHGDGTICGRVQSFLAYSLTSVGVLLSLLSIFLSRSLSDELVHRQILVVMTKPVSRWQFLLGKWLGVALLNAGLLALTGAGIYLTVTQYLAKQPPLNPYDAHRLFEEILVARHASPFEVPDFTADANRLYESNLEEGKYDHVESLDVPKKKQELRRELETRWRYVPTGQYRDFEFRNLLCDRGRDSWIQLRYRAKADRYPTDDVLRSFWAIGDPEKDTATYTQRRRDVGDRWHTMPIPADAVAADGTLKVRFNNINLYEGEPQFQNLYLFEGPRAVEAFFVVGTFGGNLVRALLLMQFKLMFLAAVALAFVTVFSFPVACLCSIAVYVLAATRNFVGDAFGMLDKEGAAGAFRDSFTFLLKGLYLIVPDFAAYNPVESIVDGRNVTLAWVLWGALWLALVGTGLMLLLSWVLFHRREVSEVSV